jgi:AraC-like DNA-binding protein
MGELWIGTDNGLFRLAGKSVKKYSTEDGLSNNYIAALLEDSNKNLWIGTMDGLNRLKKDPKGGIDVENSLISTKIFYLFEDKEKNLWVGTYKSGIKRLKDAGFISYEPLKPYEEEIFFSMFQDRSGYIWIGTVSGKLLCCRGDKLIEIPPTPKLFSPGIGAISEDNQGNLWIGTNGKGVFSRQKGTFIQYTTRDGLSDNQVTSICRDSRENLWFSTFSGVSIYSYADKNIISFKAKDGLLGDRVHNVYEDKKGNIWIAADEGITEIMGGYKNTRLSKKGIRYYLKGIPVTCIYEDTSVTPDETPVYWAATDGQGLKRLKFNGDAIHSITSYTKDNGLLSNSIFQFLEDNQGYFWMMGKSGILRVAKSELNRFAGGHIEKIHCTSFGTEDGLKSIEFNNQFSRNSLLKTQNGEYWFITRRGISIMNPQKIGINKTPPPVIIEGITFKKQSIFLPRKTNQYEFKGTGDFSAQFTAPTFLSPEKVTFKYILEGFEKEWNTLPPGKDRAVHYNELRPGSYAFRVIARNADGVWNKTGASVIFTIQPFFHQTLLFQIVVLFLGLSILTIFLYILRKNIAEKGKKYKTSSLNSQYARECIKKLEHLMAFDKIYRDTEISLQILAKKISIKPYLLSQIINEHLNKNFYDFVNYYRIEEAKQILVRPDRSKLNIDLLAGDVGFKTKAAFYKAFRKYTGKTPKQYKKEMLNKK